MINWNGFLSPKIYILKWHFKHFSGFTSSKCETRQLTCSRFANTLIWVFNVSDIAIYWEYAGRGKEWLVAFHMVVGGVVWVRSFPPCFGSSTLWERLNSAGCGWKWKGNLPTRSLPRIHHQENAPNTHLISCWENWLRCKKLFTI